MVSNGTADFTGPKNRDDERQIKRCESERFDLRADCSRTSSFFAGAGVCGPSGGRFKNALVKKIALADGHWDDSSISPIIRQTRESPISNFVIGYDLTNISSSALGAIV